MVQQLDLPFDDAFVAGDNPALWTPRDIWTRLNQRVIEYLHEDRRYERKGTQKVHLDDLATYYSAFSNTPDGGLIIYGVQNNGDITGCRNLSVDQINDIEACHLTRCPQAEPEFKRIAVDVDGRADFCLAVYAPYIGRLVETNKGEAWIRYVQMAREGTQRIRKSMKDSGLPDPQFKQEALHGVVVRVTLMNDHETRKRATDHDVAAHFGVEVWKTLQEHEVKIAAYAFRNGEIQVSEAQRLTGRTWATSKKDLEKLTRRGILTFIPGAYTRDPKATYKIRTKAAPPNGASK